MGKTFYICSYGGSGSKMLQRALARHGKCHHMHSRNPVEKLEFPGSDRRQPKNKDVKNYIEWFSGSKVPENQLCNNYVIYIYKNPINSIYSRFVDNKLGLVNIQAPDINYTLKDILEQKKDLYEMENFYNNWTTKNPARNYKIICVKYDDIFNKETQKKLCKILGIKALNLVKKETQREKKEEDLKILNVIFSAMNEKIKNNPDIFIV